MEKLYNIQPLLIFLIAFYCGEVYSSISRLNKRVTNVEVKLDTINSDIAAFRLDMIDIWDVMDEMANSKCPAENLNHSVETKETVMGTTLPGETTLPQETTLSGETTLPQETTLSGETHVSEKMLYSALQSEKKFVREQNEILEENINALEQGQKHIEVLVNKQSESIENLVQDIKVLNNTSVSRAELNKVFVQNIDTITNKIFVLEHAQQENQENVKILTKNFKTAEQDKKTLDQKVEKIDQLQSEVKTLKETLDTVMNQMKTMQLVVDKIKARTSCLPPWHSYGESCYYFSASELSWSEALNDCRSKGAYLAEHKDSGEAKDLAELALLLSRTHMYWVGASDSSREGTWIWRESSAAVNFHWWTSGNPDNYRNKDCMSTYMNQQGRWIDLTCSTKLRYICQTSRLE